jgi:membrane protein YdbS with pleckstrin-like domain
MQTIETRCVGAGVLLCICVAIMVQCELVHAPDYSLFLPQHAIWRNGAACHLLIVSDMFRYL